MKVIYKKTQLKDIKQILFLFQNVFKRELSKKYYLSRYLQNNRLNSYIALYNNEIVGHIGFTKNNTKVFNNLSYIVYSRHTSMIIDKMRRQGIYNNLCNFAYKDLNKSKVIGVVIFPNKNNLLVINKKYYNYNLQINSLYTYISKKKYSKKNEKKFNLTIAKKILKYQNQKSFFMKNISFYKKNYINLVNNNFYYFSYKNKYLIYSYKIINNLKYLYILELPDIDLNTIDFYKKFLYEFGNNITFINIWIDQNSKSKIKIIKSLGFKKTNKKFNINFIPFNKFLYNSIENFDNNYFSMGDTDVFHNIN